MLLYYFSSPLSGTLNTMTKYGTDAKTVSNLLEDDDGILSAPELPPSERFKRGIDLRL